MWYKIKPLDTLFFRDGRPFTMGSETWANLIFPPYPSTLYGAIRSWLIFERGNIQDFKNGKFKDEIGTPNEKGKLSLKGPFIAIENKFYFPIPIDMLDMGENKLYKLDFITKPETFLSYYPLENILINKSDYDIDEVYGFIE